MAHKNPEDRKEQMRRYNARDDVKKRKREYSKKYYYDLVSTDEGREMHRLVQRLWAQDNKELVARRKRERYREIMADPVLAERYRAQRRAQYARAKERAKNERS